jgi:hypothetical protein
MHTVTLLLGMHIVTLYSACRAELERNDAMLCALSGISCRADVQRYTVSSTLKQSHEALSPCITIFFALKTLNLFFFRA